MTVLPKIAFFSHFVQVSDITTNFLKNLANLDFLIFDLFPFPGPIFFRILKYLV